MAGVAGVGAWVCTWMGLGVLTVERMLEQMGACSSIGETWIWGEVDGCATEEAEARMRDGVDLQRAQHHARR